MGVCLWGVVGNSSGEEGDSRGCDSASDVPVEDQKGEAIKNLQEALIGKDEGKAAVLLGAARFRHKLERSVPARAHKNLQDQPIPDNFQFMLSR